MSHRPTRRTVLASATIVPLAALTASAQPAPVFSAAQLAILEAFADRLVPADETGPGARECGAVNYIAQTLADFAAAQKPAFVAGLASLDEMARKSQDSGFASLAPAQQDEVLTAFEKNSHAFFGRVRQLTLEGMFSDPYYGGNQEFRRLGSDPLSRPAAGRLPDEQKMRDPSSRFASRLMGCTSWPLISNRSMSR